MSSKLLPANPRFPSGVAYINFGTTEHATAALRYDGAKPLWNAGMRILIQRQDPLPPPGSSHIAMPGAMHAPPGRYSAREQAKAAAAGARQWVQLLSRSTGKYYWFNTATNQSSWQVPPQVLAARTSGAFASSTLLHLAPERPQSKGRERSIKWAGRGGPEHVGQRFRRLRSTGEWLAGLIVQCKQVGVHRYAHRVVYDAAYARPDEWMSLEQCRWLLESDYQKSVSARGRTRETSKGEKTGKRGRPRKERARRTARGEEEEEEEEETSESGGEFDSFLASSDEVLPQSRARRRRSAEAGGARGTGGAQARAKTGKGVRKKKKIKVAKRFHSSVPRLCLLVPPLLPPPCSAAAPPLLRPRAALATSPCLSCASCPPSVACYHALACRPAALRHASIAASTHISTARWRWHRRRHRLSPLNMPAPCHLLFPRLATILPTAASPPHLCPPPCQLCARCHRRNIAALLAVSRTHTAARRARDCLRQVPLDGGALP
jgi:hypothetical protein